MIFFKRFVNDYKRKRSLDINGNFTSDLLL